MGSSAEQMMRRAMLFEQRVVPTWSAPVDAAILELMDDAALGAAPSILVAEGRTGHMAHSLLPRLSERTRLMVVDPSSEMLDLTRKKLREARGNIFYSSQSMTRLSYADGVFHVVLCSNGLLTRGDLKLAGKELIRVMRDDGYLGIGIPLRGTFDVFEDMFREATHRLEMRDAERTLDAYIKALLTPDELMNTFEDLDLDVLGHRLVEFDVHFENAEDFLFSPFVEGLFLPRWLAVCNDGNQREALFFDIVRSINTYFQGLSFPAHVRVGCVVAKHA